MPGTRSRHDSRSSARLVSRLPNNAYSSAGIMGGENRGDAWDHGVQRSCGMKPTRRCQFFRPRFGNRAHLPEPPLTDPLLFSRAPEVAKFPHDNRTARRPESKKNSDPPTDTLRPSAPRILGSRARPPPRSSTGSCRLGRRSPSSQRIFQCHGAASSGIQRRISPLVWRKWTGRSSGSEK